MLPALDEAVCHAAAEARRRTFAVAQKVGVLRLELIDGPAAILTLSEGLEYAKGAALVHAHP